MTGGTHYDTMGLPPDATIAEIHEAFARLIEGLRQDGSPSQPGDRPTEAALRTAYEVLTDPRRRAEHDWRLGIDDLQPLEGRGPIPAPHPHEGPAACRPPHHPRLPGWLRLDQRLRSQRRRRSGQ